MTIREAKRDISFVHRHFVPADIEIIEIVTIKSEYRDITTVFFKVKGVPHQYITKRLHRLSKSVRETALNL